MQTVNGCWNGGWSNTLIWTFVDRILGIGNGGWQCQWVLERWLIDYINLDFCWADFWRWERWLTMSMGAGTVVDRIHQFELLLSGFFGLKMAFDNVNWRWNDSGLISLVGTFVENIWLVECDLFLRLYWGTLRRTQKYGSSTMAWPLWTCNSRFAMQQKQQQSWGISNGW